MGDIKIKQTANGIELWRTTKAFGGSMIVVPGSHVEVPDKDQLDETLAVFERPKKLLGELGS